jgi:hypothetical protein
MNDIYTARQEIIEATSLNWHICQLIRRYHPLGSVLIDMPIIKAQAAGREITIQNAPQIVIDRFNDATERLDIDTLASSALGIAKTYGKAAILVGQRDADQSQPINHKELGERTFFNVVDPLNIGSGGIYNQDPNRHNFLQAPNIIQVSGKQYHSSRCVSVFNPFEPLQYLNFNQSALSYAPPSVFERPFPYLKQLLENDIAIEAGNKKVGAIIHKKAFAELSPLEKANRSIMGMISDKLSNLFSGGVAVIGQQDEITTVDLQHFSQALETTTDIILERISISSSDGIPVSMLRNALVSSALNEGDNNKAKENEIIQKHQQKLKTIYNFFDRFVMRIAWNDKDWYATVQQRHPEYRDIPHKRAINQWIGAFTWDWNPIDVPTEQENTELAKAKAEISEKAINMVAALQLPSDVALNLLETHFLNLNDMGIFPNKFDFDADSVRQSIKVEAIEQQAQALSGHQPQLPDESEQ